MNLILPILAQATGALEQGRSKALDGILLACLAALVLTAIAVGARDVLRLSPTRLWALSLQTFRESVRRRVLLLIPGAMALIVVLGLFQRSFNEVGQIHQTTETCIRVTGALTLLLMILLSAFAFPRELESRTIYSLLTKPITRLEVFLGKLIGLWMVAAAVLALMGAFSYGYLQFQASRLARQADARLGREQRDYEQALPGRGGGPAAGGGATTRPDGPGPGSPRTIRRAVPPDAALRHQVQAGLLTAANYIDSAPVRLHPVVPLGYLGRDREWILTGRGYLGLYVFDLPEQRPTMYHIALTVEVPAASEDEKLQAVVRLFIPEVTPQTQVKAWGPPRALYMAGWKAGVSEPMVIDLRRGPERLWQGTANVSGDFNAIGPARQLAVSVEAPSRVTRMIGLIRPHDRPQPPFGMLLAPRVGDGASEPLRPRDLLVFPRSRAAQRFPLGGSEEGYPAEVADYAFENIPLDRLPPGDLVFELRVDVDKGSPLGVDTRAVVRAIAPSGRIDVFRPVPSTRLGCYVRVPRELAEGGRILLQVRPEQSDDVFTLSTQSVRLVSQPTPFAVNLVKSLLVCQLEAMVVVGLGVMGSVFLSWPVALLLTSVLLIAGNLLDVVRGLLTTPGGMNIFQVTGEDKAIDVASQVGNEFFKHTSRLVERIVPDFTRFDPVAFIGQGLNIPWATVGQNAVWALIYLGVSMAIGYLALHFKEVAK